MNILKLELCKISFYLLAISLLFGCTSKENNISIFKDELEELAIGLDFPHATEITVTANGTQLYAHIRRHFFDITIEADSSLEASFEDKEIFELLSSNSEILNKFATQFNCGDEKACLVNNLTIKTPSNEYAMNVREEKKAMTINDEVFNTNKKSQVTLTNSPSSTSSVSTISSSDRETNINGKDGTAWLSLTDNQKFHAISNALHNLDNNGYSILENEYFFITALNEFYNEPSTRSIPVSEALASIGVMSGALLE
jgi:hypothetical protein